MGVESSTQDKADQILANAEDLKLKSIKIMDDNYNMKMIIRGFTKTGKSTLWARLRGMRFISEYVPTSEIQVGTIDWTFKNHEDTVKVEIWDIVDEGFAKEVMQITEVKEKNDSWNGASLSILDASLVDVYQGTNAVIVIISPFSIHSLEYARKEAQRVPLHVAVLFLLNFRDCVTVMQYDRYYRGVSAGVNEGGRCDIEVGLKDVHALADSVRSDRNESDATTSTVHVVEASLLNCWGLVELNKFFDIPFLMLKKKSLEDRLRTAELNLLESSQSLLSSSATSPAYGPERAIDKYQQYYQAYTQKWREHHGSSNPPSSATDPSATYTQTNSSSFRDNKMSRADQLQMQNVQVVRNLKNIKKEVSSSSAPSIVDITNDTKTQQSVEEPDSPLLLHHSSPHALVALRTNTGIATPEKKKSKKSAKKPKEEEDSQQCLMDFNPTGLSVDALDSFLEEDDGMNTARDRQRRAQASDSNEIERVKRNDAFSDDITPEDNRVRLVKKKRNKG